MSGKSFGALLAEAYARPSNVDWCESNYAYSPLIAEMWNTASSVPMTFVAIFGLWKARECLLMESRWAWAWAMLAVVGVGSALFHATLLHGGVFPRRAPEAPRPRRIIQMFDIYPEHKVPGEPHTCDKVLHIWAPDKDLLAKMVWDQTVPGNCVYLGELYVVCVIKENRLSQLMLQAETVSSFIDERKSMKTSYSKTDLGMSVGLKSGQRTFPLLKSISTFH